MGVEETRQTLTHEEIQRQRREIRDSLAKGSRRRGPKAG
jgi:hypothetical protein